MARKVFQQSCSISILGLLVLCTLSSTVLAAGNIGPAMSGSTGARAADKVNVGDPSTVQIAKDRLSWNDGTRFESCGQTCLLQKANENIQVQAYYVIKQIEKVANAYVKNPPDNDAVWEGTKDYCPDLKDSDWKDCFKRFLAIRVPVLRSMQTAIIQNNTYRDRYVSTANGRISAERYASNPKNPQSFSASTQLELAAQYKAEEARLNYLASDRYADWVRQEVPHKPDMNDFYFTKPVSDPTDPTKKVVVFDTDSKGNVKLNKAAYDQALAAYKALDPPVQQKFIDQRKANPKADLPVGDAESYQKARNEFVNVANGNALKTGVAEISFNAATTGQNRSTANAGTAPDKNGDSVIRQPGPGSSAEHVYLSDKDLEDAIGVFEKLVP